MSAETAILDDDPTEAELAVLEALWSDAPATIRSLADRLYPGGRTAHYATVQKLLERLEGKGCVRRRREGRVNVYSPTVNRGSLIRHRLHEVADRLCGGSLTPLLTHLVDGESLSRDEVHALRRLVERLEANDHG